MRQAVIYLRVSTIEQTTANQERELREIATQGELVLLKMRPKKIIVGRRQRCQKMIGEIRHGSPLS